MYRVVELQTNNEATAMIDHGDFSDRNQAESQMHGVAMYAAISTVEIHSVVVLNPMGERLVGCIYKHKPAPAPEPEPEPEPTPEPEEIAGGEE